MLDVKNEYLYHLLERIKQRPGMYLGQPTISRLHMLLVGYSQARMELGLPRTSQEEELDKFQDWIQRLYSIDSSQDWASIILGNTVDEKEAFHRFFELFGQFCNQLKSSEQVEAKVP